MGTHAIPLTLEPEVFKPCWWYSVKLDFPPGYTEKHHEDELVPETEIKEQLQDEVSISLAKFQVGTRIRLNGENIENKIHPLYTAQVLNKQFGLENWKLEKVNK